MAKPLNYNPQDEFLLQTEIPVPEVKPKIVSLPQATVFADGSVFTKMFEVVPESLRTEEMRKLYTWSKCLKQSFYKKRPGRPERVYISVADYWGSEFYHWFADAMPRLLLVIRNFNLDNQAVILSKNHRKAYIEDSLKRLNITNVIYLDQNEKMVCPELVLPTYTAANGFHHPTILKEIKALFHQKTEQRRRIFFSRRTSNTRKIINEFEVNLVLQKHGFELIELDSMSFEDRVKMMNETQFLVSVYGADLTHCLFMHPGTHVVELRKNVLGKNVEPKTKRTVEEKILFHNTYYRMCEATDMNYSYLLCESPTPDKDASEANLVVDTDRLDALISNLVSP